MQDFFDRKLIKPLSDVTGLSIDITTRVVALFMMAAIVFSWYSIGGVLGTQERGTVTKTQYENI